MKRLLTKILAISCLGLLLLPSCKKDETRVVSNVGKVGTLTASTTSPALSKANAANVAVTFTWPATPVSGYNAPVTYTLQLDKKGNNFASAKEVTLTTLTKAYTVGDLNDILLGMKLSFDATTDVDVRIKSTLAPNLPAAYTNVVTLTVKPYPLVSFVYLPGAYQGWSPQTADSLKSATSDGVYTGIINFTSASALEFKITPAKVWDHSYGTDDNITVIYDGGSKNLKAPAAGLYWVTVDLNTKKITFTPVAAYYSIIGNAAPGVAWSTDTDMKYNNGTSVWDVTATFTSGEFKVRKNHDWTISYGVPKSGADGVTLASSEANNIPLPTAGIYYFTFKPIGTDDKTATYTLTKK